ncbi:MAG: TetR family transcriptional regulator [Candidatus Nanopelagicales bacterium]
MSEDPTEALLHVARDIIAKRGYVGLTMRTAAAAAGVTPEVARRYYNNREELFAAALRLPDSPVSVIPALLAPGIEGMGEQLVRFTLDTLRDPQARDDLMSMARTGVSAGQAITGLQEFIEVGVVDRVASTIGVPDARMRASLITSYLMGVAIMRYGVRLEPLASVSEEEVIRMVAPVIQDLLDPRRPIPGSARDRARAAGKSQKAVKPGSRRGNFDPDPAATRAAKQRAEVEAAARASAEARRTAARSAPKPAAGSMARPAASSPASSAAADRPAEPPVQSTTRSTTKPAASPAAEADARPTTKRPAEPSAPPAKTGATTSSAAKPDRTTTARATPPRTTAAKPPRAGRTATARKQAPSPQSSGAEAGTRKAPGATTGGSAAAAPDRAQEPSGDAFASEE